MGRGSIALVAAVVALFVVGCGGGDASISTSTISKEAFIKKADAVCKKGFAQLQRGFAAYLKENKKSIIALRHPSRADYEGLIGGVLVPNLEKEIEEIRALGAPSGDEDRIEEILTAFEEGIETAESNRKAVTNSSEAIFGIGSRLAKEYGLEVCGSR
ncbi:MAG: hypothetical protein ACRDLL_15445 [Solirubrobacterales bacterium]